MCVDDDGNVVRRAARLVEERLAKWLRAEDPVHRDLFLGPFFAYARLDQDPIFARLDEGTIHVQANPIELVGRRNTFPKNTRDDSKHRPAVQSEFRVRNYF